MFWSFRETNDFVKLDFFLFNLNFDWNIYCFFFFFFKKRNINSKKYFQNLNNFFLLNLDGNLKEL